MTKVGPLRRSLRNLASSRRLLSQIHEELLCKYYTIEFGHRLAEDPPWGMFTGEPGIEPMPTMAGGICHSSSPKDPVDLEREDGALHA